MKLIHVGVSPLVNLPGMVVEKEIYMVQLLQDEQPAACKKYNATLINFQVYICIISLLRADNIFKTATFEKSSLYL